jgi:hypothetical protein
VDADGYGFRPDERTADRLLQDFRTLSPAGIERAAWGRDLHVGKSEQNRERFRAAEETALDAIRARGHGDSWEAVRAAVYGLTEGDHPVISWEAEHEESDELSRSAQHAAYGAALALVAGDALDGPTRRTLMTPLAEALPWLLPGFQPTPLPERSR